MITFVSAIVQKFVANAIPSKPRATNDGIKSNNKRIQLFILLLKYLKV